MMRKQSKMYAAGGKLKMTENADGKKVPFFAADGKGKMMAGGMVPKTKGYFKGGKVMKEGGSIGSGLGKKGEKEELQRMLEGRESSSRFSGRPLKKEDISTTMADPRLEKSDITKKKTPAEMEVFYAKQAKERAAKAGKEARRKARETGNR